MPLTIDQIAAVAAWQPIQTGFGREDLKTAARVKDIVGRINATLEAECELVEDDGLSNYFVLFAFEKPEVSSPFSRLWPNKEAFPSPMRVEGLAIYLSA